MRGEAAQGKTAKRLNIPALVFGAEQREALRRPGSGLQLQVAHWHEFLHARLGCRWHLRAAENHANAGSLLLNLPGVPLAALASPQATI
jgi:hypothetical protein